MGISISESHLMHEKKKGRIPFSVLDFSHCSGELLSLGAAADLVQKRQGTWRKEESSTISELFPIQADATCTKVSLAGCCLLLLQTLEGFLSLSCFLFPNRLSQGNSPQAQQFPFSSPSSPTFCCSPPTASPLWTREGRNNHQSHNPVHDLQGWLDFSSASYTPPFRNCWYFVLVWFVQGFVLFRVSFAKGE